MRFNDSEVSLIKNTFAENDDLLFAIRKVFLQMELSSIDMAIIVATFKDKPANIALMWKTFLPTLDEKAPIHQLIDLWMTIEVKDRATENMMPVFKARELLIKLLDQQLHTLENVSKGLQNKPLIDIAELVTLGNKTDDEFFVGLTARNTLINHVETQLTQLSLIAGLKTETPDETINRLAKDSSK